jgi:hypothetical protein
MSSDLPIQDDLQSTTRTGTPSTDEPETAPSEDLGISTPKDSTWQAQLSAARAEIAEKVQKQQLQDGWSTFESVEEQDKDVDEPMMSSMNRERRASAVTEDGEEDQFIAELLRPGSRTSSTKEQETSDSRTTKSSETPPSKDAAEEPTPEAHEAKENVDEKMCRICFDSEEQELGKLFRPCKCKGSVSFSSLPRLSRYQVRQKHRIDCNLDCVVSIRSHGMSDGVEESVSKHEQCFSLRNLLVRVSIPANTRRQHHKLEV